MSEKIKNMFKAPMYIYLFTFLGISFGFAFKGLPFFILAITIYWILSTIDIFTGFIISKKHEIVSSEEFGSGIIKRLIKSILLVSFAAICSNIRFSMLLNSDNFINGIQSSTNSCLEGHSLICSGISIIPLIFVTFFLIEEIISLIENATNLSSEDNSVLKAMRKIFGIGLSNGLKYTQKRALQILKNSLDSEKQAKLILKDTENDR